jgi:hypothetical protein
MKDFINRLKVLTNLDTPPFVTFLKHIEKFSSPHFAICFTALRNAPRTTLIEISKDNHFDADNNFFDSELFQMILTRIKNNKNITSLEISLSELLKELSTNYIEFFKHLPNIKSLIISLPKDFQEEDFLALTSNLVLNNSFENLFINGENLPRKFTGNIPIHSIISKNPSLKTLRLANISLSDQEV